MLFVRPVRFPFGCKSIFSTYLLTGVGMGSRPRRWLVPCVTMFLLLFLGTGASSAATGHGVPVTPSTFDGILSALATGSLTLSITGGVAVDGMGNIYVGDIGNLRVVEVTAAGVASVVSFPGLATGLDYPLLSATGRAGGCADDCSFDRGWNTSTRNGSWNHTDHDPLQERNRTNCERRDREADSCPEYSVIYRK